MEVGLSKKQNNIASTKTSKKAWKVKALEICILLLPGRAADGLTQVICAALKKLCPFAEHVDVTSSMVGIHVEGCDLQL